MSKAVEAWRAWVAEGGSPWTFDKMGRQWCALCDSEWEQGLPSDGHAADCPYQMMRDELNEPPRAR